MNSYKLVNPVIFGSIDTEFSADTGIEAVSKFWNTLSTHITNNMPSLYITLKDSNNQLSHYKISEKLKEGSKTANYTISELDNKMSKSDTDKFLKDITKNEKNVNNKLQRQSGGVRKPDRSRHDGSSSSSDSDSDDYFNFTKYKRPIQPISMWYYTPSIYNVKSVFVPTFTTPIVPYVKIWIPSWV